MKTELKALGQITWYLTKTFAILLLAQQAIWFAWVVMG